LCDIVILGSRFPCGRQVFPLAAMSSMGEIIEYPRRNLGKLYDGSSGIGTDQHFTGEQIWILTGDYIVDVLYKTTAQALFDVVAESCRLSVSVDTADHCGI